MTRNRLSANLSLLLGAIAFSNPLRAQEQIDAADGVSVDSLQGVQSSEVDANGDLLIILENGQTVTVPAADFLVVDGNFFISPTMLDSLGLALNPADLALGTAGGSGTLLLGGAALLGLLAAAGGGGGGGDPAPTPPPAPVNNAPVFTSDASSSLSENSTDAYAASATDAQTISYSISGTDASLFSIDSSTGAVSFIDAPDFETPTDADGDNVYDITVTASDGSLSSSQTVNITVTNVDEAPVITSVATADAAENDNTVITVVATDAEGATLTYTLSGADAALFTVDPATGEVSFITAPDFENPTDSDADGVYDLTVSVSDGVNTTTQDVVVTVTDENDAAVITSDVAVDAAENTTTAYTIVATDQDGDTLTYSISGDDAALFAVDAATGVVTFVAAPDFETSTDANADGVYDITVTANDGTVTTDQDVAITVTDVNDAPVVSGPIVDTAAENAGLTVDLLQNASDQDVGDTINVDAASLIETSGNDASGVTTSGNDLVVDMTSYDYLAEGESVALTYTYDVVDAAGETVSTMATITITGTNDDPILAVTDIAATEDGAAVTGTATFTDVDTSDTHVFSVSALAASEGSVSIDATTGEYTYEVGTDFQALALGETAVVTFDVTVTDNNGGADTETVSVTVTGTNDAPILTVADIAATEDGVAVMGTATFTDVDLTDTHTFSATAMAVGEGSVAIDATTGEYTYEVGTDFQALALGETAVVTFDVTVTDNNGGADTQTVSVTVTGTNDAPVLTVADIAATEDGAAVTGTATFTDVDVLNTPDTHTFTVSTMTAGEGSVAIDAATGEYTYEVGTDFQGLQAGETTTVTFDVTVTDNNGGADTQTVTVTITGTNDDVLVTAAVGTGAVEEDVTAQATGTVDFTDVDLLDDHLVTSALDSTDYTSSMGTFAVVETTDTTGTGTGGLVTWTYDIDAAASQELAAGQVVSEVYTITIDDQNGDTVTQDVTITITGTNDVPVVDAADVTGAITELAAPVGILTDSGTIAFTDVDLTDSHSLDPTIVESAGALGTFTASVSTQTDAGGVGGTISWNYLIAASDIEYLAEGETRDETFTITLDDGNGGTVDRTITVTLTGTNDAPTITSPLTDAVGAVVEDASAPNLVDTGFITFNDIDLIDTHTTSIAADAGNSLGGILTLDVVTQSPATEVGTFNWTYTAATANANIQSLADGETATETFTVTISDGEGGTVDQIVVVTVTGTNDTPVVSAIPVAAVEDGAGVITAFIVADVDTTDGHIFITTSQPSEGSVINNNDGTFTFSPGTDFQDLALGETRDVTFNYVATDDSGTGNATSAPQTVTITVTGTNDTPVTSDVVVAASAVEDGASTMGSFIVADADTTNTHTFSIDTAPTEGSVVITGATFVFSPGADFQDLGEGEARDVTFTYIATDNDGAASTASTVTVTVTGTNDQPVAGDVSVTSPLEDGPAVMGNFVVTDADTANVADTHTFTIVDDSGITGGTVTNNMDGTFTFDPDADFQSLAQGETLDVSFTYIATDDSGALNADSTAATVTFTVTGTNDAPTVTAVTSSAIEVDAAYTVDLLAQSMAVDVDNGAMVTFEANSAVITGTVNANGIAISPTALMIDQATGIISVDPAQFTALDHGQTVEFTITFNVTDGIATVANTATITLNGDNAIPVITAVDVAGVIVEAGLLTESGSFTFTDGDAIDAPTASVTDTTVATALTLDAAQQAALEAAFTISPDAGNTNNGTINWDYTITEAELDFLAAGETVSLTFEITVDDAFGGTATQDVTIMVTGTNDIPVVTGAIDQSILENDADIVNLLENTTDVDATDVLTVMNLTETSLNDAGGIILAVDGNSLSLDPTYYDFLAFGETIALLYTYDVSDGNGGVISTSAEVTIVGDNDMPTISIEVGDSVTADLDEAVAPAALVASGTLSVEDLDTTDIVTATVDSLVITGDSNRVDPIVPTDAELEAMLTLTPTPALDGTVTTGVLAWDFNSGADDFDYLAEGETLVLTYSVLLQDDSGVAANDSDTQTITVTITGTNDDPVLTVADLAAVEDGMAVIGNASFTDVDLADTHVYSVSTLALGEGSVTIDQNGQYTYEPGLDFQSLGEGETTIVSFDVTVTDSSSGSHTQTVDVVVTGTNDAPILAVVDINAVEDAAPVTGSASATDVDALNTADVLTYSVTQPSEGSVSIDAMTGLYTFDPGADFQALGNGEVTTVTFDVIVTDDSGAANNSATQTVTVTITGTNDAPIVSAPIVDAINEDTAATYTIDLLQNASDVDQLNTPDVLDVTAPVLDAGASTATFGAIDGRGIVFNAATNQFEIDASLYNDFTVNDSTTLVYTYDVIDDEGGVTPTSVSITIDGQNDAPTVAAPLTFDADEGGLAGQIITLTGASDVDNGETATLIVDVASVSYTVDGVLTPATIANPIPGTDTPDGISIVGNVGNPFQSIVVSPQASTFNSLQEGEVLVIVATYNVQDIDAVTGMPHGTFVEQTTTITITGTNDAPIITSAVQAGAILETADVVGGTDADPMDATGTITFDDVDLLDTHTAAETAASVSGGTATLTAAQETALLDNLSLVVTNNAPDDDSGTIDWTYAVPNSEIDFLAVGETVELSFTVTVTDDATGSPMSDAQDITITITGTNDTPTITAALTDVTGDVTEIAGPTTGATLATTGTVTFNDVDLIDTHTTPATAVADGMNTLGGTLALGAITQSSTTEEGSLTWTYNVDDANVEYLAEGETTSESFTVTVTDNNGDFVDQVITVTVTGTNDAPVIAGAATSALTEADAGLTDTGMISVEDVDIIDTVSTAVDSVAVAGTGAASAPAALDNAALLAMLSVDAGIIIDNANTTGNITWAFNSNGSAFDFLATGETLELTYVVSATDSESASDTTTVTVTVTGTNDTPVITSAAQTGAILETDDVVGGTDTDPMDATGTITFDGVDVSDVHTATETAGVVSAGTTATLTPVQEAALLANLSLSLTDAANGTGTVDWTYAVPNSEIDFLAVGEIVELTFTVEVEDALGLTTSQDVVVTITGTNDAPTVTMADATGAVTENSAPTLDAISTGGNATNGAAMSTSLVLLAGDVVTFDWDYIDNEGGSATFNDFAFVSINGVPTLLEQNTDPDTGSQTYTFVAPADGTYDIGLGVLNEQDTSVAGNLFVDNLAVNAIVIEGFETGLGVFTATGSATTGAAGATEGLAAAFLTSTGATAADIATALSLPLPNLTDTGTLTFNDIDLVDVHTASVALDAGNTLGGTITLSAVTEDPTTEPGTLDWTYVVDNAATEYLAEGETTTETFTITVNDGNGGTVDQVVVITITGTNDLPAITAGTYGADFIEDTDADGSNNLAETGAIEFTDVDLIDTHTAATTLAEIQVNGVDINNITVGLGVDVPQAIIDALDIDNGGTAFVLSAITNDSTGDGVGSIEWNFNLDNTLAQFLPEGQSITVIYDVVVTDSSTGVSNTEQVSFTITGTNDAPVITSAAQAATVTETADVVGGVDTDAAAAMGTITFDDIDITDIHTASETAGVLTSSSIPLTAMQEADLLDNLSLSAVTDTVGAGSVDWTYTVANSELDYLPEGETVVLTFTVEVADAFGGTATQDVIITLVGTNDAPEVTAPLTSDANEADLAYDIDLLDGAFDVDYLETTTLAVDPLSVQYNVDGAGFSTVLPDGVVLPPGNLLRVVPDDSVFDHLPAGVTSTIEVMYDIVDAQGASVTQTVLITITGTNDIPTITASMTEDTDVVEAGGIANATAGDTDASGLLTIADLDDGESTFVVAAAGDLAGTYGNFTFDEATGAWTYTLDDSLAATQALNVGDMVTETLTVTSFDGTTTEDIVVNITGSNDNPTVTSAINFGSIPEGIDLGTSPANWLLVTGGANDVDDGETATLTLTDATWTIDGIATGNGGTDSAPGFTLSGPNNATISPDFSVPEYDYLAVGESTVIVLSYNITDINGASVAQTATFTITGTNDVPVITGGPATSALTETDAGLTDSGTFTVGDVDVTDVVTAAVDGVVVTGTGATSVPGGFDASTYLTLTPTAILDGTETTASLAWDFNSGMEAFDFLADSETLILTYTVSATDDNAAATTETVTVTITGTNDDPVITSGTGAGITTGAVTEITDLAAGENATSLTDSGTITFDDVDITDTHVVLITNTTSTHTSVLGSVVPVIGTDSTGTGSGTIDWTYTVDDSAVDFLGANETITETFEITVDDGNGAIFETVTITIQGTNDAPVITVVDVDAMIAEDGTVSETGSITFADVDLTDTPTATEAQTSISTVGATLTMVQQGAIEAGFTISADAGNTNNGTINWDYTIDNADIQFLAAGESVTLVRTITVDDGSGTATATATQDVTITLTGTNDAPVITVGAGDSVAETLTETDATLTTAGTLTVNDIDDSDVATASTTVVASGDTAGLLSGNAALAAMLSFATNPVDADTGDANNLDWAFNSAAEAFDYLAHDQSLTLTYTVTVDDGNGGTDTQDIVITITGTNDAPTVIAVADSVTILEDLDASAQALSDAGVVNFDDIDTGDMVTITSAYNGDIVWSGGTLTTALSNVLTTGFTSAAAAQATPGSTTWDYAVSGTDIFDQGGLDFLGLGETITFSYTITATDDSGAANDSETEVVTITIAGTDDAAVIVGQNSGIVTEFSAVVDTGNLDHTDVDNNNADDTFQVVTATPANSDMSYGSYSVLADGNWTYTVDSSNSVIDALAAGESTTDSFTVLAEDGTSQVVNITINGSNDAPVITVGASDSVSETIVEAGAPAAIMTTGTLTVNDVDTSNTVDSSVSAVVTATGDTAGLITSAAVLQTMLTVAPITGLAADTGDVNNLVWTFDSASDTSAFEYLNAGETLTLTYVIDVTDGALTDQQTVVVNITGTNDIATITASGSEDTSVIESISGGFLDDLPGDPDAGGMLTVTDLDFGQSSFQTPASLVGTYGTWTFDEGTGVWAYVLDNNNAAVDALDETTAALTDSLTVTSLDGTATFTINVSINGQADGIFGGTKPSFETDVTSDNTETTIDLSNEDALDLNVHSNIESLDLAVLETITAENFDVAAEVVAEAPGVTLSVEGSVGSGTGAGSGDALAHNVDISNINVPGSIDMLQDAELAGDLLSLNNIAQLADDLT